MSIYTTPAAFDAALDAAVERIATEQGAPVPVLERSEGHVLVGSIFDAAHALGVKASAILATAEQTA